MSTDRLQKGEETEKETETETVTGTGTETETEAESAADTRDHGTSRRNAPVRSLPVLVLLSVVLAQAAFVAGGIVLFTGSLVYSVGSARDSSRSKPPL